ncbi:unnamed protein product [Mytilus coruscus]|uniref:Uncharacterized protein n=1 Tax=Mytilus coruscus TaxID=42192 RepID=A0A6J8E535_MYTCO|nr:unnamed protein product [Mytilus coruscus]
MSCVTARLFDCGTNCLGDVTGDIRHVNRVPWVGVDVVKSGPATTLDVEQEARLVDHIKMMANFGYGYTRSEVVDLATDYAMYMKLRGKTKPFTLNSFYSFMSRWPELKTIKARGLAISRAKSVSQENIDDYQELEIILVKYNLVDNPHCIYNIDEKGVNFQHKPPNVVGAKDSKPPGARMNDSLIGDCTNGTSGSVSGTGCDAGHVLPDTGLNLPDTRLDLPDTRRDLPDTGLDLPDTRLDLTDTGLELPAPGNITLIDEADPTPDEDEMDILTNTELQKSPAGFFKQCKKNIGIGVKKTNKKEEILPLAKL